VWVVKRKTAVSWFGAHLDKVVADVEALRNEGHDIAVDISIYVTCDDTITSGQSPVNGDIAQSAGRVEYLDKRFISHNIAEVSSLSSSSKGCCCTRLISDEDVVTAPCTCEVRNQRASSASSISLDKSNRTVDSRISIISGRPHVENIIRKTAELALGEMAVVVCGPPDLVQCTRNAVVNISDDRAVHKGTGAQGIYVHAEAFGYA
jgi:hypothetical protein